jgi:hypothetical protein
MKSGLIASGYNVTMANSSPWFSVFFRLSQEWLFFVYLVMDPTETLFWLTSEPSY